MDGREPPYIDREMEQIQAEEERIAWIRHVRLIAANPGINHPFLQ